MGDIYPCSLYTVLKPQGFRKNGSCFRRELENGIVWEVEIQKSQFNMPSQGWSQYDELLQQYHKKSVEEHWKRVKFYEDLKERISEGVK